MLAAPCRAPGKEVRKMAKAKSRRLRKPKAKPRPLTAELPPGCPHVLDIRQACRALNVRETKLYTMIGAKELPAYKLGDRLVFKPDDVAKLIASLPEADIKPARRPRARRLVS
jgi:excisionase family DNA binding protein